MALTNCLLSSLQKRGEFERMNGMDGGASGRVSRVIPTGGGSVLRNRATRIAEAMLDAEAEILVRTVLDKALYRGDPLAMKLCIERLLAPRRHERVRFAMPSLETPADAVKAVAAIAAAVADGDLAPAEAGRSRRADAGSFLRGLDAQDFEQRLAALEKAVAGDA